MKPEKLTAVVIAILLFFPQILSAESSEIVYAFRNYKSSRSEKTILVGEITSKTKLPVSPGSSPYKGYDARIDQVTVKVKDRKGIKIGQKLYVVDKNPHHSQYRNALITGEIEVKSLFHSPFYGWVLTGTGILLRIRKGNFVVRTLESENLEYAYTLKKKGDHYVARGDTDRAIASYLQAVEADRGLPEAHAALGTIYFTKKENQKAFPVQALAEFQEAYRHQDKFRYDYDRFQFCNIYMETLDHAYRIKSTESRSEEKQILHILDRILEMGSIASRTNEKHPDILLHLFRANYYKMNFYKKRSSVKERNEYEASQNAASEKFLSLLQGPISSAETHRIAALYLDTLSGDLNTSERSRISGISGKLYSSPLYILNRSSNQIPSSPEAEQKLYEMVSYHVELYFRYLDRSRDPADPVLERLKGKYLP